MNISVYVFLILYNFVPSDESPPVSGGHMSHDSFQSTPYTGQGTLTYSTLTPRHQGSSIAGYSISMASSPMATTPMVVASPTATTASPAYEEVPAHEPRLDKKPLRSALKGAKKQELLQRQLQMQLQEKQKQRLRLSSSNSDTPKAPPKVAPKPKTVKIGQRYVYSPVVFLFS